MVYGITFGEKHSFNDWRLLLSERPNISPPEVKTDYIDIPGGDGSLDFKRIRRVERHRRSC